MILRQATPPKLGTSPDPGLALRLHQWVAALSEPRHFTAQPVANRHAAERIAERLHDLGYDVRLQGPYRNVVAWPKDLGAKVPLVGAHYDSVPSTPGADDNASGVAGLLELARLSVEQGRPVAFVGFNCEEDGLVGSREFVASCAVQLADRITHAHVLEMIGFCASEPGSQQSPLRLLPGAPDVGDFIAIAADYGSRQVANRALRAAADCPGGAKLLALTTYFGMHRCLPDLARSDHSPFWEAGIPALMWTDTAELRNPNYHSASDTPDTLDYAFMARVVRLIHATLAKESS